MNPTAERSRVSVLAWSLAGLALLVTSAALPFVTAEKLGRSNEGRMLSGVANLWAQGQFLLAILVAFTGLVAPLVLLALLAGRTLAGRPPGRAALALAPWAMPDVRLLAILVAFVKLSALVHAAPAAGLWCYGAAAVCTIAAVRTARLDDTEPEPAPAPAGLATAAACGLAALGLLVPAYLLPVMHFSHLGQAHSDTIFSSVLKLWHSGLWGLALIVFTASLLVPILKLAGLAVLLAAGWRPAWFPPAALPRLHALLHGIGRWSMLDVFLVAFLCGIVNFGDLAGIEAQPGVLAFAGAVVLTMIATAAFDARHLPSSPSAL